VALSARVAGAGSIMAHRYALPVLVDLGPDGVPTHFSWRGERYRVRQVLAMWHLRDRW
jgi:hypothetical protein